MKCPTCEKGKLKKGRIKETMFGVNLGEYPAEICGHCRDTFTDEDTMKRIEQAAKRKGIWGLGKTTKIIKTGNSLAVRIPKEIATYLRLKAGKEAYLHPEGNKLVIES